jgi:chromosome partitioning protein
MRAKVIAIGNLKGGTGKSTISVNLACALGGYLLDADIQGTSQDWLAQGNLPISGHFNPITDGGVKDWLVEIIKIKARPLIIDLPSNLGANTAASLTVADVFLIPVTPSPADFRATSQALELVRKIRSKRGGKPHSILIPSRVDRRTGPGKRIEDELAFFNLPLSPCVGQRTDHVNACWAGRWVGDFAPGSPAHREIMALADFLS